MRFCLSFAALGLAVLATGCASNSYCLGKQDYDNAEDRIPLQAVSGLKLPESPTALRVPKRTPDGVPYGVADAKGDGVCLDKPPTLTSAAATEAVATPAKPAKKK
jgi:hypothetical protein